MRAIRTSSFAVNCRTRSQEHRVALERPDRRGRLDQVPAVLFVIDEAANCRLDAMPQWAATVSGIGVQLVTVWQSKAQIEAVYGRQADAILTNHLSKLFFPGMSDQSGLDYVGALTGQEHVPSHLGGMRQDPWDRNPASSVPFLPANVLRQMRPGQALLVHGHLPPVQLRVRRHQPDLDRHRRSAV